MTLSFVLGSFTHIYGSTIMTIHDWLRPYHSAQNDINELYTLFCAYSLEYSQSLCSSILVHVPSVCSCGHHKASQYLEPGITTDTNFESCSFADHTLTLVMMKKSGGWSGAAVEAGTRRASPCAFKPMTWAPMTWKSRFPTRLAIINLHTRELACNNNFTILTCCGDKPIHEHHS